MYHPFIYFIANGFSLKNVRRLGRVLAIYCVCIVLIICWLVVLFVFLFVDFILFGVFSILQFCLNRNKNYQ